MDPLLKKQKVVRNGRHEGWNDLGKTETKGIVDKPYKPACTLSSPSKKCNSAISSIAFSPSGSPTQKATETWSPRTFSTDTWSPRAYSLFYCKCCRGVCIVSTYNDEIFEEILDVRSNGWDSYEGRQILFRFMRDKIHGKNWPSKLPALPRCVVKFIAHQFPYPASEENEEESTGEPAST